MVYWFPADGRNPAAIKKVFDFSHLEGSALKMASHKRLLADANIIETEDRLGIDLGHFVVKGTDNSRKFACDVYNKIELTFESADMSVSGEPSIMTLQSPCKVNNDINRINTLWIPMKKIMNEKEGDIDIEFNEGETIKFSFSNIGDRWPRAWTLSDIRMYNDFETENLLQINRSEMNKILDRPLTLVWDKDL
jgi:hypothetical protein